MPALTRASASPIPQRYKQIVGRYIREHREAMGLTQRDLLHRMGCRSAWFTVLAAVEIGDRDLPPSMWPRMADAFGIPRPKFAAFLLRYTQPWAFAMLVGGAPEIETDLAALPDRYGTGNAGDGRKAA